MNCLIRSEACLTDKKRIFSVRAPLSVSITPSAALTSDTNASNSGTIGSSSSSSVATGGGGGGTVTASGAGGASSSDDRSLSRVSADSLSQLELMLGAYAPIARWFFSSSSSSSVRILRARVCNSTILS